MGADEPGRAGHEHAHDVYIADRRLVAREPSSSFGAGRRPQLRAGGGGSVRTGWRADWGAEVRTLLIAQGLAAASLSVAHSVFPVAELRRPAGPGTSLSQRRP
jgi:hypothetical protein